jgi:hypothetical protein
MHVPPKGHAKKPLVFAENTKWPHTLRHCYFEADLIYRVYARVPHRHGDAVGDAGDVTWGVITQIH